MSCLNCDNNSVTTFVRVGNGDVKIVGCQKHLRQLIENNRQGLKIGESITANPLTYEKLSAEGMEFLAKCGQLTIMEQSSPQNPVSKTSVNEVLGMGTRILAEQAHRIQAVADIEEIM